MRQGVSHKLGVKPVLDDAALVLGAALERRLVDFGLPCLGRHFQESRAENAVANVRIVQELWSVIID